MTVNTLQVITNERKLSTRHRHTAHLQKDLLVVFGLHVSCHLHVSN